MLATKKLRLDGLQEHAFTIWIAVLAALLAVGLFAMAQVFIHGLGITNLTNQVPWGLWITVDLSSIALSGGAFFLSALVYIVGIKRFMPAARLGVFVGLLGYGAALCTLLLDIGRPDRFYHPLVFWNTHSMLWEVSMCIVLYFSVLTMEVFPLVATHPFFDRLPRVRQAADFVHKGAPVLAFMGLFFSLLHQSSLGATYGVIAARPIWFRPTMPLMFITSAVACGPALVIALALLVGWIRGREIVPRDVLFDIGKIAAFVLLVYLYMRFWDAEAGNYGYVPLRSEATSVLSQGPMALSFWGWEILLGGVVAAGLLLWAGKARSEAALFTGAGMAVVGLIMNRWHTTMIGFLTPLSTDPPLAYPLVPSYTPALTEWAVAIGIVAGVMLLFSLGMRYLPAFELESSSEAH
jgi:Ni/Fe-hydrogenase subunit HybB-like protein